MNIVVLTSDQLRHRYFTSRLNSHFPLAAIGQEKFLYPPPSLSSEVEREAWDWFFRRRQEYETKTLGSSGDLPAKNKPALFTIGHGELNSRNTLDSIKNFNPDLIVIYGTSLLGPELVQLYDGKVLNLHVGLPEYCRGSGCNFWPIYYERVEFLGATVHMVDQGIDTGAIVRSDTIDLDENDDEQSLGGKPIILGTDLMISAIYKWGNGPLRPSQRKNKGDLFLMKNFTPQAILRIKRMVESGDLKKLIQANKRNGGKEA